MVVQAKEPSALHLPGPIGLATAEELRDPGWAWAAYEPDARRPWNLALAAHLYRRAAFGADWTQLQQALADGPQRTVDRLLEPQADVEAFNRTYDGHESVAAGSLDGLRAWWLRRMVETPQPLLEKMTLFWHNHFATNGAVVGNPRLMQEHVRLLRRHALGSFASLLQEISRDPAMLIWLGADANRKVIPNERFVRPLLETFTLGPGEFSDQDVREAARAFTGWFVLRGQLRYLAQEHDDAVKRILGREGEFSADEVIRIVLEQPATARMPARKLYRWLISETEEPDAALLAPLAESFAGDYSVSRLVERVLRSNAFFSQLAYRRRIKGPVEFAVGIVKAMEGVVSTTHLAQDVADLGQDLCRPPTAKGWPGGRYWINNATVARRSNLSSALLRDEKKSQTRDGASEDPAPYGGKLDPWAVARRHGYETPESAARFLLELFLQGDLQADVREAMLQDVRSSARDHDGEPGGVLRRFAQALVSLPEFHLA
jgi:uncharacterized protein (DUF1800 family)